MLSLFCIKTRNAPEDHHERITVKTIKYVVLEIETQDEILEIDQYEIATGLGALLAQSDREQPDHFLWGTPIVYDSLEDLIADRSRIPTKDRNLH